MCLYIVLVLFISNNLIAFSFLAYVLHIVLRQIYFIYFIFLFGY